jgi:hypothetical protein
MQDFLSKVRLSIRAFFMGPIDRLAASVDVAGVLPKQSSHTTQVRFRRKLSRRKTLDARLSRDAFGILSIFSTLKSLNQLT